MAEKLQEIDSWDDPLAVKVGLQVGANDIPAEGWPDTFKEDVVTRILGYLPIQEEIYEGN